MDYVEKDFGKILKNNAQTLRHDLLPAGTDCFRVYDRNLSRYPVTVDLYGKYAKVTDYGEEPLSDELKASCLDICSRMLYLDAENVIYAYRAKRAEHQQHEKTESEAVRTTVKENGLSFTVDLTTYVDTGLFLDHAVTRQMIRERSANADVLNLFSYTGSFSVYAAAGFANTVTSVDMSATYTKWAEENLEANGYSGDMYKCVYMDATKFVAQEIEKGHKYDIIIFDPPSFSNSRKMEEDFDVARDYVTWIRNLFSILKKTGIILFSTNLGTFRMDKRRLRGLSVKEITGAVGAPGFVKGRAGTTRSWMMAFDEESLSLDWSEPEKKSEKSSDSREKSDRGSDYRRSERRSDGERRNSGRRDFHRDGDRERRPYGERRSYGDKPYRERSQGDRPSYGRDRAFGERSERSERPYGDRPYNRDRNSDRSFGDRPYRRNDRYSHHDRFDDNEQRKDRFGGRSYERKSYEDREDSERTERSERRSYGDRPYNRERSFDRERSFNRDRRPSYGEKREFHRSEEGTERRSFDRDRRPSFSDRGERRPFHSERGERSERSFDRDSKKSTKKPFGYDSFKPARSREDSTDFFWNTDDLDPKPRKNED